MRFSFFFSFIGNISFKCLNDLWDKGLLVVGLVRSASRSQVWPDRSRADRTPRSQSRSQRHEISPSDRWVHPHHRRWRRNLLHPSGETPRSLSIYNLISLSLSRTRSMEVSNRGSYQSGYDQLLFLSPKWWLASFITQLVIWSYFLWLFRKYSKFSLHSVRGHFKVTINEEFNLCLFPSCLVMTLHWWYA